MVLSVLVHLNSLKSAVPAAFMLGLAPQYFTGIVGWRAVSAVFPERWFRVVDDRIWGTFQRVVEFFFESLTGTEIILYGDYDALEAKENVIYLCNHQSTMDWIVVDMMAIRAGCLGRCRFILKDGLKYFPLFGYYFNLHGGIYVKRGRNFDESNKQRIMRRLSNFREKKLPIWMIVYPEGTRFKPKEPGLLLASRQFAENQGLPVLHQVLSPRYKATYLMVQGLKGHAQAIYDVTIAYSGDLFRMPDGTILRETAPSMGDFLSGKCKQVHIHLRRIPMDGIPDDENEFQRWLHGVFQDKDKMLLDFYSASPEKQGRLHGEGHSSPLSIMSTLPAFLFSCGLMVPVFGTTLGRQYYWRTWIAGSLLCCFWMKFVTR
ncbi:1-acyl-sn-glycerol-3-phosphate acyltransferase epsilon-like [Apostichopus japonicus]|uniref:1-acyl-sn-glycerol-3-phosphate acyltransferase epsilon-like n=1 Tax=Stichopus japonicus TaxID=307972 RepID=UPI003AB15EE3